MFLFFISFLLVFSSSYLITSLISPKKGLQGLINLLLISFSQLVLTFEILSLFTAIKQIPVLLLNILFFTVSVYLWNKKQRPLWTLGLSDFWKKVINSFKLDISLIVLFVGFVIFIATVLILNILMPITSADAHGYHVGRSVFWVLQGSLNHINVADVRNLCLPINSEILYSWVFLFVRNDLFLGFFGFAGYLLSMTSIYGLLNLAGFCTRKKLWVIFIISSFPCVLVQASGTETDIIIAGLVISSVYLFWNSLKYNKKAPLFMSSLAYALAIGTKTTALMAIPSVGLLLLALCYSHKKIKPLGYFVGFGLINFLIFSSYNYILNYIQFSNFLGPKSFMVVSKNYFGIKGAIANFIKYLFLLVDFTGFKWSDYVSPYMMRLRDMVLHKVHLGSMLDGLYTTPYLVNRFLLEPLMGAGILGLIAFFPSNFWALIKPTFVKGRKVWFCFLLALTFWINLAMISYLLAYMSFSIRFIMFFIVLASPALVYSYYKKANIFKVIFIFFAMFNLVFISTHLWPRPLDKIAQILIKHPSIAYLRENSICKGYEETKKFSNATCMLTRQIRYLYAPENKILAFLNSADSIYLLKSLEFDNYKIDFKTMEDVPKIDFDKYNLVISSDKGQTATLIKDYETRKDECRIKNNKFVFKKVNFVPCLYMTNPRIEKSTNPESKYPYQARCGMSKEFLEQKHLVISSISGVAVPDFLDFSYYIIYRNTKFPPKYKTQTPLEKVINN